MISWLKKIGALTLVCAVIQPTDAASLQDHFSLLTAVRGQAIYRHLLEHHWIPDTGLFASFPDSQDARLAQQASTYEQAAMGLLALQIQDRNRAETLLQFFKQRWTAQPHGLMNFYNADFGTAGIEKTVHVGPNAWVGLFAARMANRNENTDARQLALDIAYWIATGVPHHHGAVAMGISDMVHGAPWAHIFSTENNISYYAFLSELLKNKTLDAGQRQLFAEERSHVENWLLNVAFDKTTYRVRRGEIPSGIDAINALDTVTWLISAVGCARLAERGIDPERLLNTAASLFEVSVDHHQGVDPADQAEADLTFIQDHAIQREAKRPATDHHRMIWYEGLGQYILALTATAQFLKTNGQLKPAQALFEKAKMYQVAFDANAVASANNVAYPYATPGRFFRDGWRTPAPAAQGPASSLIASVWRIFSGLAVDPLSGHSLLPDTTLQITLPKRIQIAPRMVSIYYGTSEDMTTRAWGYLNTHHYDQAIEQAKATIQEWSDWAAKLENQKAREAGGLLPYTGEVREKQAIFNYWALNDVAAAYFILGKAYDEKENYLQANEAFRQIVQHYSLAQIWDPKGWFWSPVEAVTNDFVAKDPAHYGAIQAG